MPNNVLLTQIVVCKQHWYFCSLDCDVFIRIAKNPKSKLSANANMISMLIWNFKILLMKSVYINHLKDPWPSLNHDYILQMLHDKLLIHWQLNHLYLCTFLLSYDLWSLCQCTALYYTVIFTSSDSSFVKVYPRNFNP